MTLSARAIRKFRRVAEDARDNREKAVIDPDILDQLLDHASTAHTEKED